MNEVSTLKELVKIVGYKFCLVLNCIVVLINSPRMANISSMSGLSFSVIGRELSRDLDPGL